MDRINSIPTKRHEKERIKAFLRVVAFIDNKYSMRGYI